MQLLPEGVVCTAAVLRTPSAGSLTSPPWSVENSGRRGERRGEVSSLLALYQAKN